MAGFNFTIFLQAVQSHAGDKPPAQVPPIWQAFPMLMRADGPDFLRHAYHYFYSRDVDPRGVEAYLEHSRSAFGRFRCLCSMYLSEEARNTPAFIKGVWSGVKQSRTAVRRLCRR